MNPLSNLTASLWTPAPLAAPGVWFRDQASTFAGQIDWLFYVILWICVFFFVLIVGMMIAFIGRYYARPGHNEESTPHHNNVLEASWSIIPGFLVLGIFGFGFTYYLELRTPPADAYEINVIAKKWNFAFQYPNGVIDANLHVPVDRPVKLILSSDDVIHSLYIPAFRVKCDCVPGRYSTLWFEAKTPTASFDPDRPPSETGSDENGYDLFCTEYCGQGHSTMIAKVVVHESGTFEQWLEEANKYDPSESPVERGAQLYKDRGCSQCHSLDGAKLAGPTWKGTYGTQQATNKGQITVDENYIRESILEPMAKIREGYQGVMPSYQGQLKDKEIAALIYFIKSLQEGTEVPDTWTDVGGVPGQDAPDSEGANGAEAAAPASDSGDSPATDSPATDPPADDSPAADPAAPGAAAGDGEDQPEEGADQPSAVEDESGDANQTNRTAA
ncbi:c-type cytochrome [Botrimarina sp.]|uniref:cytochrome c oxidase subunit II n=1 Tax=Botrimarina sp. TaxID=2795802 RepID=UPI0032F007D8